MVNMAIPYLVGNVATVIGTFTNSLTGTLVDPPVIYVTGTQGDGTVSFSYDTGSTPASFIQLSLGVWVCKIPLTVAGRVSGKMFNPGEPDQVVQKFSFTVIS